MTERKASRVKAEPVPKCAIPRCKDEDLVSMKVSRKNAAGRSVPEVVRLCRSHAQMVDVHAVRQKTS
jgi:hypothetical protein